MNFKTISFVLLALVLFATTTKAQNPTKIRVDPKYAYGGNISEYFNEIEYIPLETTKESLFGDIGDLIITDDSFVITDNDTKSILFFKKTGEFIKKIKFPVNRSLSVKYYQNSNTLQIVYIDGTTYEPVSEKTFTIYGEEKETLQTSKQEREFGFITLEPGYTIKFNNCQMETLTNIKDSTMYLVEIYKGDSLYNKFLPVNPSKSLGFCYFGGNLNFGNHSNCVQNGTLLVSIPIEQSIYQISKDKAEKLFDVSFPVGVAYSRNVLQITDLNTLDSLKKISPPANLIYNLTNMFFDKGRLVFKGQSFYYMYSTNSAGSKNVFNFIYNPKTNTVAAMELMTPDSSSYHLPVFNPRGNFMIQGIKFYKSDYYSSIPSLDMFAYREATSQKQPQYPTVLQKYFITQNRKSNPVLVRMRLKE